MFKIPTDSRMDFDYSVSTENRFALRNWLDRFVEAVNYNDKPIYEEMISVNFKATGFREDQLDRESFLNFISRPTKQKTVRIIRMPELTIKFRQGQYLTMGTFEQFNDGILSYEGTAETVISQDEDKFCFEKIEFFPRLKIKT